jgi:hypothetical protein
MNYPIQVLTKERDDLQIELAFHYKYGLSESKQTLINQIDQLDKAIERETNIETGAL